jgi:hypothetical protein
MVCVARRVTVGGVLQVAARISMELTATVLFLPIITLAYGILWSASFGSFVYDNTESANAAGPAGVSLALTLTIKLVYAHCRFNPYIIYTNTRPKARSHYQFHMV